MRRIRVSATTPKPCWTITAASRWINRPPFTPCVTPSSTRGSRPGIGTDWRAWPKAAGRGVRSNYRPRPKKVVSWLRAATQKVRQLPQRLAAGCDVGLHLSSPRR